MAIFIGGPLDGRIVPQYLLELPFFDARALDGSHEHTYQYREKIIRYRRMAAVRNHVERIYFVAPDVADDDAWVRACKHAGWKP